jgi:hypothetical protein
VQVVQEQDEAARRRPGAQERGHGGEEGGAFRGDERGRVRADFRQQPRQIAADGRGQRALRRSGQAFQAQPQGFVERLIGDGAVKFVAAADER